MELPLSYVENGTAEIAAAGRPNWRLFRVPHVMADTPQDDMPEMDNMTKRERGILFFVSCWHLRHLVSMRPNSDWMQSFLSSVNFS